MAQLGCIAAWKSLCDRDLRSGWPRLQKQSNGHRQVGSNPAPLTPAPFRKGAPAEELRALVSAISQQFHGEPRNTWGKT